MQLYQRAGMKLLGLNDHEGLWSKKEEFWRNKPNGDFQENVYKRDLLPFSTTMYVREQVLKETSYKDRFMEKSSKAFFPFPIKIWRFQNKVLLNKSISFSFQQGYRVFKASEVLFKQ